MQGTLNELFIKNTFAKGLGMEYRREVEKNESVDSICPKAD